MLPEKWSVKGGEKLMKTIDKIRVIDASFFVAKTGELAGNVKTHYYFDGKNYDYGMFIGELVTTEQLEDHFLNKNMEKKVKHYKLTKPELKDAVKAIIGKNFSLFSDLLYPGINPDSIEELKRVGVFYIWFEPVYEEEKKELTLGDTRVKITIKKEDIVADGSTVDFNLLEGYYNRFMNFVDERINNWNISIPSMKIGCATFTKEEIELIIKTYKELNS